MSNPEESSTPLTLKIFWPLFNNIHWALSVHINIDVLFKVKLFTVTFSLHFKLLWISTVVQCKNLIWYELRATVMYVYKDQYLQSSFILLSYSKIIARFTSRDYKPQSQVLGQVYSIWYKFLLVEWTYVQTESDWLTS